MYDIMKIKVYMCLLKYISSTLKKIFKKYSEFSHQYEAPSWYYTLSVPLSDLSGLLLSECPAGSYGVQCLQRCQCENNADCDPISGLCACKPGWRGAMCNQGVTSNDMEL